MKKAVLILAADELSKNLIFNVLSLLSFYHSIVLPLIVGLSECYRGIVGSVQSYSFFLFR